jgi:hypothetical protein
MKIRLILLSLLSLAAALAACLPKPPDSAARSWEYTDLRALAPARTGSPSHDLVALYTRTAGTDLQVRLDLLDLPLEPDSDLYLAIDTAPGGTAALPLYVSADLEWDFLLVLPASGPAQALTPAAPTKPGLPTPAPTGQPFQPLPALIPRAARNPWLDTVIVSFNRASISGADYDFRSGFRLQAFVTPPGDRRPADSLGPVRTDSRPPARAPLLLAFWNTFPAYTPAQALRRWDGAHTGPSGGRHGLHVLLQAVRRARVPVALLDLKTATALSALDELGSLPLIRNLAGRGLLILPDALPGSPAIPPSPGALPGWAIERAAADSRRLAQDFGLPASAMLYTPAPDLVLGQDHNAAGAAYLPSYRLIFTPLEKMLATEPDAQPAAPEPLTWQGRTLLPLPAASADPQATVEGLSLEVRRALLANALSAENGQGSLLILGGDFPDSAWGDPRAAEASLLYITAHPWIHPVTASALQVIPAGRRSGAARAPAFPAAVLPLSPAANLLDPFPPIALISASDPGSQPVISSGLVELLHLSLQSRIYENDFSLAAWQAYLALFAPLSPEHPTLPSLRAGYAGHTGVLLEAARWAAQPARRSDCRADPDLDGQANCILASEKFFSIFASDGGRLLALFAATPEGGLHQVVAPTSQLFVGLGDPSTWDPAAGAGGEPAGIHGAFADSLPPWPVYEDAIVPGRLTFSSPDSPVTKAYTLTESGLRLGYHTAGLPVKVQLPLALDPWMRFAPGWGSRYQAAQSPQGWVWELAGGPRVEIRSSATLAPYTFADSRPQLRLAEDPNFDYPPGHYLPFPMALVEFHAERDFSVEILITPTPETTLEVPEN